jgi:hypothetical protein
VDPDVDVVQDVEAAVVDGKILKSCNKRFIFKINLLT